VIALESCCRLCGEGASFFPSFDPEGVSGGEVKMEEMEALWPEEGPVKPRDVPGVSLSFEWTWQQIWSIFHQKYSAILDRLAGIE
jgi:hypothetical protein